MSRIVTFKGKLDMGLQEKLHLSTNDGLTGYRIKNFSIMSAVPGISSVSYVAKIYLTDQTGSIGPTIDFSDSDLLAASFSNFASGASSSSVETVIFDKETFNQDIFVSITDPDGNTVQANYYIELEQFKLDLNSSTLHTLKNIRSRAQ